MPDPLQRLLAAVRARWTGLPPAGRWLAAGLAVAALLGVGLGLYLNRTQYVVLAQDLDPRDAAEVVAKLKELKVPYQVAGESALRIQVPQDQVYAARLALAQAGLPRGGGPGLELFEQPRFGATDFELRVNYLRAQQGELERAIMRLAPVQHATVKLAIPEKSVFVRDQQPVTAAVLVQVRPGMSLTPDQVAAIVSFLSRSVEGLKPENVTVVDDKGRLLSTSAGEAPAPSGADAETRQREQALQREMENRVQTLLEPIFGPGNAVARVDVRLSYDQTRVESRTVTPGLPRQTETVREATAGRQGSGAPAAGQGEAGAPPVYQTVQGAGNQEGFRTRTATVYDLGERREVTLVAPGAIKQVSAAVAINRADLTLEQVREVQHLVAAALGTDPERISVTAIPFNRQQPQPAAPAPPAARGRGALYGALAAAAGLAGLGLWALWRRRARRLDHELPPELAQGLAAAYGAAGESVLQGAGVAGPGTAGAAGPGGAGAAGELGAVLDLVAGQEGGTEVKPPTGEGDDLALAGDERQLKQKVVRFIRENPEVATALLQSWIRGG